MIYFIYVIVCFPLHRHKGWVKYMGNVLVQVIVIIIFIFMKRNLKKNAQSSVQEYSNTIKIM